MASVDRIAVMEFVGPLKVPALRELRLEVLRTIQPQVKNGKRLMRTTAPGIADS